MTKPNEHMYVNRRSRLLHYLSDLKFPDSWVDFTDLLSKTVVAFMSALIALGVWVYTNHERHVSDKQVEIQHRSEERDTRAERNFDDKLKIIGSSIVQSTDKRDNINLFMAFLPKDNTDPMAAVKVQSLAAYCLEEGNENDGSKKSSLLKMLCDVNAQRSAALSLTSKAAADSAVRTAINSGNAATYINTSAARDQVSGLAGIEAANSAPSSGSWYAVVASIPISPDGAASATALAKSLNAAVGTVIGACDVHIYETKLSKSFALTSGGPKSEGDARARVRLLRAAGVSLDAFAQPDKGWKLSTTSSQPRWSFNTPCG